jgi:hypothetical protein
MLTKVGSLGKINLVILIMEEVRKMTSKSSLINAFSLALSIPYLLFLISPLNAFSLDDTFYSDVTEEAGVPATEYGARGICWGDYNNDGFVDAYVSNSWGRNYLYENNGNGTFSDATFKAGVECETHSNGVAWGDYNNDGHMDLYIANYDYNTLYRNDGDGTFTDVTYAAGVEDSGPGESVSWVDFNADGHLDIYIVNGGPYLWPNVLYMNNGDGTFSDISFYAGLDDWRMGENSAWADYDNDGYQDVYVSNRDRNSLYHNNGDWTFTDVTEQAGVGDYGKGHGICWGDYDADGLMDLHVVNRLSDNLLFRNNGDGTFTDVAADAGVRDNETYTVGTTFLDFDNDGDLDLFNVSGGNNSLFSNNGDGTFSNVTDSSGLADPGKLANGMACGDYNNDGYLDIYVVNWEEGCAFFENNLTGNNWIQLKLIGTESNRAAIGARIEAHTGDNIQIRELNGGSGFLSQNSTVVQFGLGEISTVDHIVIYWPNGGGITLDDIGANQLLEVVEEASTVTIRLSPDSYTYNPGDTMSIGVVLINHTNQTIFIDGWSEVTLPGGHTLSPLLGPITIPLFPWAHFNFTVLQAIPACTPEGDFLYTGKVGDFPDDVLYEDGFTVSVTHEPVD